MLDDPSPVSTVLYQIVSLSLNRWIFDIFRVKMCYCDNV